MSPDVFPPKKANDLTLAASLEKLPGESNLSLSHKYPGRVFIIAQVRQKHFFLFVIFLLNLRDELDELGVFCFKVPAMKSHAALWFRAKMLGGP